jgi:hypothetical protein
VFKQEQVSENYEIGHIMHRVAPVFMAVAKLDKLV